MDSERDIVERLRGLTIEGGGGVEDEAADTIATLRAEVVAWRDGADTALSGGRVSKAQNQAINAARTATDAAGALGRGGE